MINIEKLDIVPYPHPALRWTAKPIPMVTSGKSDKVSPRLSTVVQDVARHMLQLMKDYRGMGLAATQVAIPWRMFVANVNDKDLVFINPEVHLGRNKRDTKPQIVYDHEGCLSFPGLHIDEKVPRAKDVYIEATDIDGNPFTISGPGLLARVAQHECLNIRAKILTKNNGYVFIKDVTTKDKVLGFDIETGKQIWTEVQATKRMPNKGKKWISLVTNKERRAGKRLICTEEHPCAVTDLFDDKIYFVEAKNTKDLFVVRYPTQSSHNENCLYNNDQISLMIGGLLGDGHINNRGVFSITHGEDQLNYLEWKKDILNCNKTNKGKSGFCDKDIFIISTSVTVQTHWLRSIWYKNNEKIIPEESLYLINAKALAIWFMDDGCLGHGKDITFHTECFDLSSLEILRDYIFNRFNLELTIRNKLVNNIQRHYLYLKRECRDRLFEIILPYLNKSMAYKIYHKHKLDKRLFCHKWDKMRRNYSAKKVLSVMPRNLESALYDLTTGTGNFFANDTLVHNCDHLNGILFMDHLKLDGAIKIGEHQSTWKEYVDGIKSYLTVQYGYDPRFGTDEQEVEKLLELENWLK